MQEKYQLDCINYFGFISVVSTLPPLKKQYFKRKLVRTRESDVALLRLAFNLKAMRLEKKMSQIELAGKVGCVPSMICNIECALNFPSMEIYLKICRALGQPRPPLS